MRYYLQSLFTVLLLSTLALEAQDNVSVKKKEFKTEKPGFEEAWRNVADGDYYYAEGGIWYSSAFEAFLKALVYNSSNAELNYKTGVSALFSDNKEEAVGFFLKAIDLKKDVADDVLLLAGRAYQYSGRFSEAIAKYTDYLNFAEKKSAMNISYATSGIEECNSARFVTKDTLRIAISNMGDGINSKTDDYSEVFTADGKTLYFGSRRELPESGSPLPDTKFDENIFISRLVNDKWSLPSTAGREITTKFCETPLFINSTNSLLYLYAGYDNGGDIKVSVNVKGIWRLPEKVPFRINSSGSETSFSISPWGNEIYYVTDNGRDNIGGKDIYFIKRMNERKWSKPRNAGNIINTPRDEESVRLSKSGDTLWFSSKGHNSIGGYDIFYSVKNKAGEWDTVKNYGYPVNTPFDELFYHQSPTEDSTFYFVSNRTGGIGGLDIYKGLILPPEPVIEIPPPLLAEPDTVVIRDTVVVVREVAPIVPEPMPEPQQVQELYLAGFIKDSESREPVLAKLDVIDISTDLVVATSASSEADGSYSVKLPAKKAYLIDLKATGFLSDMKRIDVPDNWPKDVYNLNIELIKVKIGKKVVLNNILFETGKAILTTGSYAEVDRLLNIMQDNEQMKIEVSGHTDKTGSEPMNFKLSEARAKAVVDYLTQKEVALTRMEYKGFGSLQPIDDNSTPQGRAKNRRVEFKILEF